MVLVSDYELREAQDGKTKVFLKVTSEDLIPQKSKVTGKVYLKPLSTLLFAAIEPKQAEFLVGRSIPGRIEKVSIEPYEITDFQTGEMRIIDFRYQYVPE